MYLKTYLIYCLILYLVLVIRTLLYIEKEKARREEKRDGRNRKRENQVEGCRRPIASSSPLLLLRLLSSPSTPSTAAHTSPRRTITEGTGGHLVHFLAMLSPPHRNTSPPTSRPFLASPSAPSDVFTIHTIDSRSHLTTSNYHRRDGRPLRPLLGDAIATHRHHLAADRPTTSSRATPRSVCHPPRLVLLPVSLPLPHVVRVWQSKRASSRERKRENQCEGCRRPLCPFIASPLLRLMSSPSTPSTAAHHLASLCQRSGRGRAATSSASG